jgi:hypothetical protein
MEAVFVIPDMDSLAERWRTIEAIKVVFPDPE